MIKASVVFDKSIVHCNGLTIVKDFELWFIYDGYIKVEDWESGDLEEAVKFCLEYKK